MEGSVLSFLKAECKVSDTASSLFITPHTKIILAAFPPDFMGLFIPPSHYIPNRKNIGASHRISVHLAKQFQRRRILKISQSETRVVCGGHGC
jgi:hypothetical protein